MKFLVAYVINGNVDGAGIDRQFQYESEKEPVSPIDEEVIVATLRDSLKYYSPQNGGRVEIAGLDVKSISAL